MLSKGGQRVSRRGLFRTFGRLAATGALVPILVACQQQTVTPSPTVKPQTQAQPTAAPAPSAATAPTASAAPTAAPATAPAAVPTIVPAKAQVAQGAEAGLMRPTDGTPKRGGTLRNCFGVTTPHYDIHQGATTAVLCQMYNGLVRRNLVDGLRTIIPDLAQSWDVSPDGLTYTFHLRSGVKFHDGTPFSADDVVATFTRIVKPPSGIAIPLHTLFDQVASVEKSDDMTVTFTLKKAQAFFMEVLALPDLVIYPKAWLDKYNNDLRKVIAPGTGAFKYQDYRQAEKWTFVRNPDYWDKDLPYLDQLELLHVPAWSDRGTAVLTDQSDMTWNASRETWQESAKHNVLANKLPNFGAYAVIFNCKQKPLDDPRVRQAISLAVSRQDLIQAYITQEWIDLTRWVPHGDEYATPPDKIATLPGYRPDKSADIAQAKKLLADAGYKDGISGLDFLSASVAPHAQIMAPAVQDQLKRNLGIEAKIRVQERSLLGEQERSGKFGMVLDTPGGSIPDFSPIANLYFKTGASQNYGGYSNPKFDDLLAKSDAELDHAKRREYLDQMQDILDQDPPWLLIGYTFHLPMWQQYVKGLAMDKRIFAEWGRVETAWIDK
jgi:peptide/nickel transport system substrate-binding protein